MRRQVASKQLGAIQSQVDSEVLEAETKFEFRNDTPWCRFLTIPGAPPTFHWSRQPTFFETTWIEVSQAETENEESFTHGQTIPDPSRIALSFIACGTMPISSKNKHCRNCQFHTDLARELHSHEEISNTIKSYNITSSNISYSHNSSYSSTYCYFLSSHVEQTEPLPESTVRPFLEVASKQLEAIQSRIESKVLEAVTESEKSFSDSNEMPRRNQSLAIASAPPTSHRPRQDMIARHSSQCGRTRPTRNVVSSNKKGKRGTENTIKENDRLTINQFFCFLYFLAFCSLLFFLIFLFLLSVLFLFCMRSK